MNGSKKHQQMALLVVTASLFIGSMAKADVVTDWNGSMAKADVVTDWNVKAGEIVVEAKLGPAPANRVLAIVQTAVYEAANAITKRYPASGLRLEVAPGASIEAAVATANHATLAKCVPSQQEAIDTAYQAALALLADSPAKTAGIAVGEKAAGGDPRVTPR